MISHSATTEATTFPDSIGIEPGLNYHTVIEMETEKPTFDPTRVLDDHWNKRLYELFIKSSPAAPSFVIRAVEILEKEPDVLLALEKQGLILRYYLYSMEYVFSVLKWTPQGVRR